MNLRKVLSFAIGPLGTAALGFVTLPILTWYYAADDIGRLSMQQVVTSFSLLLFSLGLDQAFVREFHEEQDKAQLLRACVLPGLALLLLALMLLSFWAAPIAALLFSKADPLLALLVFVTVAATFVTRFLSLILRMQERGLAFSFSQMLPKALFLMLVVAQVAVSVKPSIRILLAINMVSSVAVTGAYAWSTRSELGTALVSSIDRAKLRIMIGYALPLVVGGLAFWGLTAMDRMFLRAYSSLPELAVYSVSANFAAGAAILQSVFGTLWAPTVYRWAGEGDCLDKVDRASQHVLFVVILIFVVSGLLASILPHLLPAQYVRVQYVFMACLAYPLLYTLSETTAVGIGLKRKSGYSLLASALALVTDLACNYCLVPRFGAGGAAVSSALAFTVFLVIRTEASARIWRSFPRAKMYFFIVAIVFNVSATALMGPEFGNYAVACWLLILASAFFSFTNSLKVAYNVVAMGFQK